MIKELRINYIYATDEDWHNLMLACDELGWSKSIILKNALQGFFRRDREFYAEAGILDAQARGMPEEDYFRALRDAQEDALAKYTNGRPAFGKSPIDDIEVPQVEGNKRVYGTIGLSAYNYVLLKVALIVDGGSLPTVIGRMVAKHLQDNWKTTYLPQIERDRACRFK